MGDSIMIVLIDNYDSFTYNLYQLLGQFDESIKVIRNDALTVDDVAALKADHIVISPGPGRPAEAGICEDVVTNLAGTVPILGICLGHQAICEAYGGTITYARELMHGKQSFIHVDPSILCFNESATSPMWGGTIHSLWTKGHCRRN